MKQKIAIIFTGGTILSDEQSGYYSLSENLKDEILSIVPESFETDVFSPYFTLSEQLDGDYLTALIAETGDKIQSFKYDGIIIIHGTDTLQFSASALSLAYADSNIPIVLVSSNYVLSDRRSNGRDNLYYAFRFIEQKIGGVFVSYKNKNENPSIYLGNSLLPHLPYSDSLYSVGGAFGCFEDDWFIKQNSKPIIETIGRYTLSKNSPVLWLRAAAGMSFPDVKNYSAVLLESYHSGTLPTDNKDFVSFCKYCGKPIYVVGVTEGTQYSSTKNYTELGLNVLAPESPVFAYITLWQLYGK